MTTDLRQTSERSDRTDCTRFDAQLGAFIERDLSATEQAWMQRHRATCADCDATVRELEQLVSEAAALPELQPPRDLWAGIEARLEAPVIPLPTAARRAPASHTRTVSVKWLAVAATMLVAVSSGVTWQLTRTRTAPAGMSDSATAAPAVATNTSSDTNDTIAHDGAALAAPTAELMVASPSAMSSSASSASARTARLASNRGDDADVLDVNRTYEREITALRRIVDERFTELDPATVTELRRNLDIIDRAIGDSRAALARDPRSGVVSAQLDRALQAKLELLRRVALL